MTKKQNKESGIEANITGNVSGQIAIGNNIKQSRTVIHQPVPSADMDEFRRFLEEIRRKVESESPPEKKDAALERVDELAKAVTEEKPDLSTMEYVKNWFGRNIPSLAGAVVSVVVHPIVGKLVEAAGDALTADFKKRFGSE